jgi:hypothetical protein
LRVLRLSPPARFAKRVKGLARGAFEHRAIRKTARENAQSHNRGQQKSRRIRRIDVRRYVAVTLTGDDASPEERLELAHAFRDNRGDLRVVRGDLQRGVGQETTEAAFERAFDDFYQECLDRLAGRKGFFDPGDARAHIGVQIPIEALGEERPLVTEGVVDTRLAQPHRVAQVAHGGARVSIRPKALHRRFQGGAFVEFTRPGHD